MTKQVIQISHRFNAPVATVFARITDHEAFGKLLGANIRRIKAGQDGANGLGSIRQISNFPVPAFEETVVTFEPNKVMEYVVSKGSPIKNHLGRLEFKETDGLTQLEYRIEFEPKLPLPFIGDILKIAIEKPIRAGFKKLAKEYRQVILHQTNKKLTKTKKTVMTPLTPGIYQHYKGNQYKVICEAKHSETEEDLVVYQCLYGDYSYWVRPKKMFTEKVDLNGELLPRFKFVKTA